MDVAPLSRCFGNQLSDSRLGTKHETLAEFRRAASGSSASEMPCEKEYTLVVVTEANSRRILLGKKHRGFGEGMVNSFGGKVEEEEKGDVAKGAIRELYEETGICVPSVATMEQSRVGTLRFTFEDGDTEMVVHLFRINLLIGAEMQGLDGNNHDLVPVVAVDNEGQIRGCDEITPFWIDDWSDIPLDNMFADDSLWLTRLLSSPHLLHIDGFFHFCAGGQVVNTIRHFYMNVRPQEIMAETDRQQSTYKTYTLEQRLFHALHDNRIHSPTVKEFKEAYAFVNAVRTVFGTSKRDAFDVVIDVAVGHGALAALFLTTTSAQDAVVVDPAEVGAAGVQRAWGHLYTPKQLRFRYECLREGLPAELDKALKTTRPDRILVVACHACQHLSDEILEIACCHGVHAAVMPCCQKDLSPGSNWKATSKRLGVSIETIMDLLLAGKCLSWANGAVAGVSYDVRMKLIDASITPMNRIIVCRANRSNQEGASDRVAMAHDKLTGAYKRAHRSNKEGRMSDADRKRMRFASGVAVGFIAAVVMFRLAKVGHR